MEKHIVNEIISECLVCEYFDRFWKAPNDDTSIVWENNTPHRRKHKACKSLLELHALDYSSTVIRSTYNLNRMQIWHECHGVCQLRQRFVCEPEEDGHGDDSGLAKVNRWPTAE